MTKPILSVFVVHEGMKVGERSDGHKYWKMRISSIHKGEGLMMWIVGSWFYSPSNLKEGWVKLRKRYVKSYKQRWF